MEHLILQELQEINHGLLFLVVSVWVLAVIYHPHWRRRDREGESH